MWQVVGSEDKVVSVKHDLKLREIEGYWEALRNGRKVPARAEVDPRGLQSALSNAFILERMAPGMARIRVAGNLLNDLLGVEVRGMPISALVTPGSRDTFRDTLEDVFRGPAKATMRFSTEKGFGRAALEGEMILLPLTGHHGDVSRVLGGLSLSGQIGSRPRRLILENSFLRQLKRYNLNDGIPNPDQAVARTRPTHVPHLRLVQD